MQVLWLTKDGSLKLKRKERALYKKDFTDLPRSLVPGEWCLFFNEKSKEYYAGFVNLHVKENWPLAFMVTNLGENLKEKTFDAWKLIEEKMSRALQYRFFFPFNDNARIIYGEADDLPGLVIDQFENALMVQINTAGMDRFRTEIKSVLCKKFPSKKIYLLDQKSYRENESLPSYPEETLTEALEILENGLRLKVPQSVLQKVGYYFDHRANRLKAMRLIQEMKIHKRTGLDLFSYVGSWGLHLLAAGVENIHFVDQGNFEQAILENTELNGFKGRAQFTREDCFHFLDNCEKNGSVFDIICSDPPAFTKNAAGKAKAIEGYTKLHTKVIKNLSPNGVALIGSCTHYVSLEELDQTMQDAALRVGRTIRLIDIGIQGQDHPIKGLSDKGNYIKYLAYFIE